MENNTLSKYPELILMEFCFDHMYEGLGELDETIVAYQTKIVEDYYAGWMEEYTIARSWVFDEFDDYLSRWYHNYCERENCLC